MVVWTMVSLPRSQSWLWRWLFARLSRVSIVSRNRQNTPTLIRKVFCFCREVWRGAAPPRDANVSSLGRFVETLLLLFSARCTGSTGIYTCYSLNH